MYRFSDVKYDAASQTAEIGAGLIWDDVYAALEPHGVNVVGGRVTGVGVAGFTLGGGTCIFMVSRILHTSVSWDSFLLLWIKKLILLFLLRSGARLLLAHEPIRSDCG